MTCIHRKNDLKKDERIEIDSPEDNNCVLCLVNRKGPMTHDEISQYFDLSKMRIGQIEQRALKKFKNRMRKYLD